jgi:acetyl esterase/lipase
MAVWKTLDKMQNLLIICLKTKQKAKKTEEFPSPGGRLTGGEMSMTEQMGDCRKKDRLDPQFRRIAGVKIPTSSRAVQLLQPIMRAFPCLGAKGVRIRRTVIRGKEENRIPVLIFTPEGEALLRPCLVYFHGGGFLFPAVPYHYELAKRFALEADCTVVFPDYRLLPGFTYPAQLDDCIAAYEWVLRQHEHLQIDSGRIAVGGDSAGGTLAAAAALRIRDHGILPPCFQMLIYPAVDWRMQTHSAKNSPDTPILSTEDVKKIWRMYLPELPQEHPEYASPMEAGSLAGLPPAYIELAELDPLHDEGLVYGTKLIEAGGKAEINQTVGTPHGFDLAWKSGITRRAVATRCQALIGAFDTK